MISYSCDLCKRNLDPEEDLRYVAKIEIYPAFDPVVSDEEDDRDHLQEIQEILEQLGDDESDEVDDNVYRMLRLDLCATCLKEFLKNPLGREHLKMLDFSEN